jgi:anthranilate/para-aminobenzoate synthase component II
MHERELLKQAYRMGRPVLGICGGSWTVLESYGGATSHLAARTHQARRGPFIREDGQISSNFAEHDVQIFGNRNQPTLLARVNNARSRNIRRTVDSNHWAAAREDNVLIGQSHELTRRPARPDEVGPDAADMPAAREMLEAKLRLLVVAARDAGVTEQQGRLPAREPTHTIEAFETLYGAPVAAVQWHPERYAVGQDHRDAAAMSKALLGEMAKAGDAYEARRKMTAEFRSRMENARQAGLDPDADPDTRSVFRLRPPGSAER